MGEIREGAAITLSTLTWIGLMGSLSAVGMSYFDEVRDFADSYLSQVADKGISLGVTSVTVGLMEVVSIFGVSYIGSKAVYKGVSGN